MYKYFVFIFVFFLPFSMYGQFSRFLAPSIGDRSHNTTPAISSSNKFRELTLNQIQHSLGGIIKIQSFSVYYDHGNPNFEKRENTASFLLGTLVDKIGLLENIKFRGGYVYQLYLGHDASAGDKYYNFSTGIDVDIFSFDISKLVIDDTFDQTLVDYSNTNIIYNFYLSSFYYSKTNFFGISALNILDDSFQINGYFGRTIEYSKNIDIVPSLFVAFFVNNQNFIFDFSLKYIYIQKLWYEVGLRKDSINMGLGYILQPRFTFSAHIHYSFFKFITAYRSNFSLEFGFSYSFTDRPVNVPKW